MKTLANGHHVCVVHEAGHKHHAGLFIGKTRKHHQLQYKGWVDNMHILYTLAISSKFCTNQLCVCDYHQDISCVDLEKHLMESIMYYYII